MWVAGLAVAVSQVTGNNTQYEKKGQNPISSRNDSAGAVLPFPYQKLRNYIFKEKENHLKYHQNLGPQAVGRKKQGRN